MRLSGDENRRSRFLLSFTVTLHERFKERGVFAEGDAWSECVSRQRRSPIVGEIFAVFFGGDDPLGVGLSRRFREGVELAESGLVVVWKTFCEGEVCAFNFEQTPE